MLGLSVVVNIRENAKDGLSCLGFRPRLEIATEERFLFIGRGRVDTVLHATTQCPADKRRGLLDPPRA